MSVDYRDLPILRRVLPHTGGRLDGDDTGYRDVAISHLDMENPDPLVDLAPLVPCYPVYARGRRAGVTPYYGAGIGGEDRMLLREPGARALVAANQILARHDRSLLVLDAFRSARTQAALWREVLLRLLGDAHLDVARATVLELCTWGRRADDTASFCAIERCGPFARAMEALRTSWRWAEVEAAAEAQVAGVDDVAAEYLVFAANLGLVEVPLDSSAPTAHGSGGAVDVFLVTSGGRPLNLGVPFDSTSPAAVIDYFEWADLDQYRALVARDAGLAAHLAEVGVDPRALDMATFEGIRAERRLLFHVMREVGATFFSLGRECGEPWHYNVSNEMGGNQASILPGAGNTCHTLLRDIRHPTTGEWMAVWGNAMAHAMAGARGAALAEG